MNSIIGLIASYGVNSIWQVPLVAAAGWLASRLVKRLGPQAEHVAWVSTLFIAVLTPAAPLFRLLIPWANALHAMSGRVSIVLAPTHGDEPTLAGVHPLPAAVIGLILILYFGSLVYFAVRLTSSLLGSTKLLQQSTPLLLTAQQDELWRQCKESFSLNTASIRGSAQISGPAVLGFREPVLLMSTQFATRCTQQDLLAALAHECGHMKRRDFQKNLFYEAVSLILAFHPVIWAIKSQIAQTREMICDGIATEMLVDSHSYARSLLRLATIVVFSSRVSSAHAISIFDANILEKRIITMRIKKQPAGPVLRCGLVIPATLFLLSIAVGGAAMAVVIEPQTTPQTASQAETNGLYKIGKDVSAPILVHSVAAEFPRSVLKTKEITGGISMISVVVDEDGMPRDIHAVHSLRSDFDANAIEAIKQYRFTPAQRLGKPVAVRITIEVNFQRY